jgi:uncharacterized protein YkwD
MTQDVDRADAARQVLLPIRRVRRSVLPVAIGTLIAALAGCGGVGGSVQLGAADAVPESVGTATPTDPELSFEAPRGATDGVPDDSLTASPPGTAEVSPTGGSPRASTARRTGTATASRTSKLSAAARSTSVPRRSTTAAPTTSPGAAKGAAKAALGAESGSSPAPSVAPLLLGPATETVSEAEVVRLVNVQRVAAGCKPVVVDPTLVRLARAHSDDMAGRAGFRHNGSDGRTPFQRMTAAGYDYSVAAENIAAGQPNAASVMTEWLASPGHRANIVDCRFSEIGVGVVNRPGTTYVVYWTQEFGTPM